MALRGVGVEDVRVVLAAGVGVEGGEGTGAVHQVGDVGDSGGQPGDAFGGDRWRQELRA
jgi:hypothetical protein